MGGGRGRHAKVTPPPVAVGGHKVHRAAQRRGLLWSVETKAHCAAQRRGLLRLVDARSTAPLRGLGCCGWWRQGPLGRSEAWAVVVGGDKGPLRRSEAWAVAVGGRKVHCAAQRPGLLWLVDARSTAPLRGVGCCGRWRQGPLGHSEDRSFGLWRQSSPCSVLAKACLDLGTKRLATR